ncbi:MAG: hypothetical protein ACI4MC_05310 [Candidatus Coproplasma sp.]
MSIFQIIDAFAFYGFDVILLAALTSLLVQILKKTVLKKCNKKIFTFLPFIIGTVFYAAYAAVRHLSLEYLIENYVTVMEHGFSVGALATLIYVCYEQFLQDKSTASATEEIIATLISGYVPTDNVEQVAKLIAEAIGKDVSGDGAKKTAEILTENQTEGVSENDVKLLAKLIIETLAHLNV